MPEYNIFLIIRQQQTFKCAKFTEYTRHFNTKKSKFNNNIETIFFFLLMYTIGSLKQYAISTK